MCTCLDDYEGHVETKLSCKPGAFSACEERPSARPPAGPSVRWSARPSRPPVRPSARPSRPSVRPSAGSSVRQSAPPSGPPVRSSARRSVSCTGFFYSCKMHTGVTTGSKPVGVGSDSLVLEVTPTYAKIFLEISFGKRLYARDDVRDLSGSFFVEHECGLWRKDRS